MFGSHPLETDGVNPNFFLSLARENKKELRSCRVLIPSTVLFEQGFAKYVFSTTSTKSGGLNAETASGDGGDASTTPSKKSKSKSSAKYTSMTREEEADLQGEVKMKAGRDVDSQDIFDIMTRGTQDGDVCATLFYAAPGGTSVSDLSCVCFFDKEDLRHFLFHRVDKPRSLLQKFVKPKGNNNCLIHAIWSPLMVLTEGRRSSHSLTDRHLPVNLRAATFEEQGTNTVEVVVAKAVVKNIADTCQTIADHFEKAERIHVNRVACYFKVDEHNNLQLLCSSSIRIQDNVTGFNNSAVNLNTALEATGKKTDSRREFRDDSVKLKEADDKIKNMRIVIPSMPDTATMLLKSIHENHSGKKGSKGGSPNLSGSLTFNISNNKSNLNYSSGTAVSGGRKNSPNRSPNSRNTKLPINRNSPGPLVLGGIGGNSPLSGSAGKVSFHARSNSPQSVLTPPNQHDGKQPQQQGLGRLGGGGGVSPGISSAIVSPARGGGGLNSTSPSRQDYDLPVPGQDSRLIYVAPGAPLPQSPSLMRYQHMLPSSQHNLEAARKQRDLHITEKEIKHDWDAFLLQQARSLNHLAQNQKSEQAAQNAESQSAQIAAALEKRDAITVPEIGHKTAFNMMTNAKTDVQLIGSRSQTPDLKTRSMTFVKGREQQIDDKHRFMQQVHQVMVKKSLLSPNTTTTSRTVGGRGGTPQQHSMTGESDPDAVVIPKVLVASPNKVPRSVLLPPSFSPYHSKPTPGGSPTNQGRKANSSGGQTQQTLKMQQQSPHRGNNNTHVVNSLVLSATEGSSDGKSIQSMAARRRAEMKATGNAAMGSRSPSPKNANRQALRLPGGGDKTAAAIQGLESPRGVKPKGDLSPMNTASRKSPKNKWVAEKITVKINDTAYNLRQKRSKVVDSANSGVDHSGDPNTLAGFAEKVRRLTVDEQDTLEGQVAEVCADFKNYIKELLYAIYCFFLEHTTTAAYVEVPACFKDYVSLKTLNELLHKLHGTVQPRASYLREFIPTGYTTLVQWRESLLRDLHQGALRHYLPGDYMADIQTRRIKPRKKDPSRPTVDSALLAAISSDDEDTRLSFSAGQDEALSLAGAVGSSGLRTSTMQGAGSYVGDHTFCITIPPLERSRAILMGEYSEGIDDDVDAFTAAPDGVFYHRCKYQLYHVLVNTPPPAPSAAITAPQPVAEESLADSPASSPTTTELSPSNLGSTSATLDDRSLESPAASPSTLRKRTAQDEELFCNRCRTCRTCCVCSLVFGRRNVIKK